MIQKQSQGKMDKKSSKVNNNVLLERGMLVSVKVVKI